MTKQNKRIYSEEFSNSSYVHRLHNFISNSILHHLSLSSAYSVSMGPKKVNSPTDSEKYSEIKIFPITLNEVVNDKYVISFF